VVEQRTDTESNTCGHTLWTVSMSPCSHLELDSYPSSAAVTLGLDTPLQKQYNLQYPIPSYRNVASTESTQRFHFYSGWSMSREEGTVSRESRNGFMAMSASDIASSSVCCGASTLIEGPGVWELSSVSNVASFWAVFGCY
jgi:hypothetical protein